MRLFSVIIDGYENEINTKVIEDVISKEFNDRINVFAVEIKKEEDQS